MAFRRPPAAALAAACLILAGFPVRAEQAEPLHGTAAALEAMGATLRWDPLTKRGAVDFPGGRFVFKASGPGTRAGAILDGEKMVPAEAPRLESGELVFPDSFVRAALESARKAEQLRKESFRIAAVVIDPGHGGKDPGAIGTHRIGGRTLKLQEKDVVLDVGLELRDLLQKGYPDKRIVMTRSSDTFPTLDQRVAAANAVGLKDNEAIVYVSVHANASFKKTARGYETWYLSPEYRRSVVDGGASGLSTEILPIVNAMMEEEFTTESIMIAKDIMARLDAAVGGRSPSRGIKAEEWFVVRNARMPSVLIELGFVTNAEDAALLADPAYLRKLSQAIYNGISDFVAKFEGSGGFTARR